MIKKEKNKGKKQNKIDLEPDSLLVASSPETGPEASLSSRTMQSEAHLVDTGP